MPDDLYIVTRCKNGDENAFEELVMLYQKRIYGMLYQLTGNHFEAEDLSQEAFIKAYKNLHSFNGNSSFQTWLYKIARNLAFTHLKKKGRRNGLLYNLINAKKALITMETDPVYTLVQEELKNKIDKALSALPLLQKEVVVLVLLQELSYKEAAEIQGCSEGTIAWRLHRARNILMSILGPGLNKEVKQ